MIYVYDKIVRDAGCDKPKLILRHVPSTIEERDLKQIFNCPYIAFKAVSNETLDTTTNNNSNNSNNNNNNIEYNNVTLSFDTVGEALYQKQKWNGKTIKENYTFDIAVTYLHGL